MTGGWSLLGGRFTSTIGAVGVDFGTNAVRMLQLRMKRGRLSVAGACHAPPAPPADAAPDERWQESLRAAVTEAGFAGRRCVVSLPRGDLAIQSVRMPRLPDGELRDAAGWEAAERFKLERDKIVVDFLRMGEVSRGAETRDEVLIVAAPTATLQARVNPLLVAGLRPVAVDLGIAALVRCYSMRCRREADRAHVRAILEMGASGSTFVVLRGDQIALCKPIPIGGRDFDQAVADHLAIELAVASDLRARRIGVVRRTRIEAPESENDPTDRAIFESVRSLLDRIAKEVSLCLRYYGVTFRGKPPDRVILSGGDSLEPRFDTLLSRAVNLPVMFDDSTSPTGELFVAIEKAVDRQSGPAPSWAVAAGLSVRGMAMPVSRRDTAPAAARVAA
jgi:type IV pilus assembly protein PilM